METFTIIKLEDKYLLLSDEEIKEGDYIYSFKSKNLFKADSIEYMETHNIIEDFDKSFYINSNQSKKLISENPNFSLLSEEDCKKIGWVDVEKLANVHCKEYDRLGETPNFVSFIETQRKNFSS